MKNVKYNKLLFWHGVNVAEVPPVRENPNFLYVKRRDIFVFASS